MGCSYDHVVYSCPVAAAREPWVRRVFAINRNKNSHIMLQQMMPEHPSAALVEAIEYVESEVVELHSTQRERAAKRAAQEAKAARESAKRR